MKRLRTHEIEDSTRGQPERVAWIRESEREIGVKEKGERKRERDIGGMLGCRGVHPGSRRVAIRGAVGRHGYVPG